MVDSVASDWVAEQKEPNPWVGNTSAASGSSVGQPLGGGVLVADQVVGVLGAEQVGPPGGAEQQRPAGEHADRADARRCVDAGSRRR